MAKKVKKVVSLAKARKAKAAKVKSRGFFPLEKARKIIAQRSRQMIDKLADYGTGFVKLVHSADAKIDGETALSFQTVRASNDGFSFMPVGTKSVGRGKKKHDVQVKVKSASAYVRFVLYPEGANLTPVQRQERRDTVNAILARIRRASDQYAKPKGWKVPTKRTGRPRAEGTQIGRLYYRGRAGLVGFNVGQTEHVAGLLKTVDPQGLVKLHEAIGKSLEGLAESRMLPARSK